MDLLNKTPDHKKQPQQKEQGGEKKEKKGSSPDKKRVKNYTDPISGVSLKKLRMGFWFVRNLPLFKKTMWILLVVVVVGVWIYAITGFGWYIFKGMKEDEKMINEMATQGVSSTQKTSNELTSSSVTILQHKDKYDLYAKVGNPQEHYTATFDYCFTQADEEISCQKGFIFPQENKYVLSLSQELNNRSNVGLNIKNINWNRIDYHEIRDWEEYKKERLDIEFKEAKYSSSAQNEYSDQVDLNTLTFTAINDTPYSYWEADLNIILYNTGSIVGVNTYTIDRFRSGEKRDIELVWSANINRVTDVSIIPNINILDKENYMKPSS